MNQRNFHLYYKNKQVLMILLSVVLFIVSCNKEPEPLSKNSVINGHVSLSDVTEASINVSVIATGPYGSESVITDEDGRFSFVEMGNGTYSLEYNKEGYGTIRQFGIQLFGNDTVTVSNFLLFRKVNEYFGVPNFVSVCSGSGPYYMNPDLTFVCIETTYHGSSIHNFPVMLFMDVSNDVSCNSYVYSCPANLVDYNDEDRFIIYIDMRDLPFNKGEEVFIKGYACNTDEFYYGYLDTNLGIMQYSTLDEKRFSNVISFIMP